MNHRRTSTALPGNASASHNPAPATAEPQWKVRADVYVDLGVQRIHETSIETALDVPSIGAGTALPRVVIQVAVGPRSQGVSNSSRRTNESQALDPGTDPLTQDDVDEAGMNIGEDLGICSWGEPMEIDEPGEIRMMPPPGKGVASSDSTSQSNDPEPMDICMA